MLRDLLLNKLLEMELNSPSLPEESELLQNNIEPYSRLTDPVYLLKIKIK
jgi:hypothetical protein